MYASTELAGVQLPFAVWAEHRVLIYPLLDRGKHERRERAQPAVHRNRSPVAISYPRFSSRHSTTSITSNTHLPDPVLKVFRRADLQQARGRFFVVTRPKMQERCRQIEFIPDAVAFA